MLDEVKQGETETSPSPLAEAIASSPEALNEQPAQETQTPAKEEVIQEQPEQQTEEQRVPYSRFKDVVDEKNWYKTQLEQRLAQQPQQQPQQPTTQQPQEIGNTPEEREFWRMQRQIAREEAERVSREQLGQIRPVIDAGRMELAQMKVQQFRAEHRDIKPNSPEEIAIAEKIQMGYLPEDAYKTVMWDRRVAEAESKGNINVKQQIAAKKQANLESSTSIPANAQTKPKMTFREEMLHNLKLAEEGKL